MKKKIEFRLVIEMWDTNNDDQYPTRSVIIDEETANTAFDRIDAQLTEYMYLRAQHNQVRTAKLLGISRGTLRSKLNKYFPGKYL